MICKGLLICRAEPDETLLLTSRQSLSTSAVQANKQCIGGPAG